MAQQPQIVIQGFAEAETGIDQNPLAGDAALLERLQDRRQEDAIGDGPGDVADDDARTCPSLGQLSQRGNTGGGRKRMAHRGRRVSEGLDRPEA